MGWWADLWTKRLWNHDRLHLFWA